MNQLPWCAKCGHYENDRKHSEFVRENSDKRLYANSSFYHEFEACVALKDAETELERKNNEYHDALDMLEREYMTALDKKMEAYQRLIQSFEKRDKRLADHIAALVDGGYINKNVTATEWLVDMEKELRGEEK